MGESVELDRKTGEEAAFVDMNMNNAGEREHLVSTAVKFLLNPRVRNTSVHQKLLFLKQKGLTEAEINSACNRAGIDTANEEKVEQYSDSTDVQQSTVVSIWSKAKDVANIAALFSIGSYSLYCLWKQFLGPRLFGGNNSRQDENYQQLLFSITKLNENVTELKELIRTIQEAQTLQNQLQAVSPKSKSSQELKEIRNELSSIKSLLLGRQQFPTSPSSGIPSWQMLEAEGDEYDESSNGKEPLKSKRKERKPQQRRQDQQSSSDETKDDKNPMSSSEPFTDLAASSSSTMSIIRKYPSADGGLTSGSSCEVVYIGEKQDSSNSDPNSE